VLEIAPPEDGRDETNGKTLSGKEGEAVLGIVELRELKKKTFKMSGKFKGLVLM